MSCVFVSIRTVIYQDLKKKDVIELLVLLALVSTREDPKITNEMRNKNSAYSFCCLLSLFFVFSVLFSTSMRRKFTEKTIQNGKTKPTCCIYLCCVLFYSIQRRQNK